MNCCRPEDPLLEHSRRLDKSIASWMKDYQSTIKFLLLGAGESGKTTILKQMKILHIQGFSQSERREKIKDIRRNILEAIKELTGNMMYLKPPVSLRDSANESSLAFLDAVSMTEEYTFPQEFYDHVTCLWADSGIQECYLRSNEFPLIDCAKYFLDKVELVRQDGYVPSDQDILHCRKRTSEIQRIEFQVKVPKKYGGGHQSFWMFDVGGQRGERRKWIQVFDGITAVLFLVACSGFDLKIREDHETNRLEEALHLFRDVWSSRFLKESGFILFLNKQDILKEKVLRGAELENFYQDYSSYTPTDFEPSNEYEKARSYIKDKFLNETKKSSAAIRMRSSDEFNYRRGSRHRDCFWHYTTATDTGNVKRVFGDIHTMIIMWNLENISPN